MEFNFSIGFKSGRRKEPAPEVVYKPEAPTASETDKIAATMRVGRPELMPVSKKWLTAKGFVSHRDMRRDPVLKSCLAFKAGLPMQNSWKIKPASDDEAGHKTADFVERAFAAMCNDGIYGVVDNLLDAVAVGYSAQEKVWDTLHTGELFVCDTVPHDPQNISFSIDDFYRVHEVRVTIPGKAERKPYPVSRFIYWAYNGLYGTPYGQGDFADAYRPWFSKNQAIIFWTRYLERNARGGIPVVRYEDGVTPEFQESLDEQLSLEGAIGAVHVPKQIASFEIIQAMNTSAGEAFHTFVKMCNEEMARGFLGASLQVDEGSRVGSKAMAAVHAQTGRVGSKKLARLIETQITEQLIKPMVKANFPGVREFPKMVLPQPSMEEMAAKAEMVFAAIDRRILSPEEEWIRSELDFQADDRDQAVVTKEKEEREAEETISLIVEGAEADGDPAEGMGKKDDFAEYKYSCLMVPVPRPACDRIYEAAQSIAEEDLVEKGREGNPHVTVLYGLHTTDVGDVARVLAAHRQPIEIRLEFIDVFECEEYDVVKFNVHSEDLKKLNRLLRKALPYTSKHENYEPHATIAYVKRGEGMKYCKAQIDGTVATINDLIFSTPDGERHAIPLWRTPY